MSSSDIKNCCRRKELEQVGKESERGTMKSISGFFGFFCLSLTDLPHRECEWLTV